MESCKLPKLRCNRSLATVIVGRHAGRCATKTCRPAPNSARLNTKAQLQAFASGARTNDINAQMRNVVRNMTSAEIDAAAAYYAGAGER